MSENLKGSSLRFLNKIYETARQRSNLKSEILNLKSLPSPLAPSISVWGFGDIDLL
jgi:hypothetical protein